MNKIWSILLSLTLIVLISIGTSAAAIDIPPSPVKNITSADDGKTITLQPNETFLLKLGEDYDWNVTIDNQTIISIVPDVLVVRGAQGIYMAHNPGHAALTALGEPICPQGQPCPTLVRVFKLHIIVTGGTTSIIVSPSTPSLTIGGNQQFNATVLDQNNQPIPGINISWTTSNSTVVSVTPLFAITGIDGNASATFDALAAGTTMVTASNGSVNGNVIVTVTGEPKLIYAYWPHQTDPSSYQPDWKEINFVADLSVDAKSNGKLTIPDINRYNVVKNLARKNGVKVILLVAIDNFDKDTMDSIFAFHREDLANNISDALQTYGADGVDIDFEHPRNINKYTNESNKNLVEELMRTLYTKLKSKNQNYYIILNVAGSVEEVYQNTALSQYIDFVFLRGYNYNSRNSTKTGAPSPYHDVINSVNLLKINYSQNKIILGLFFYGYDWPSVSAEPGANTIGSGIEIPMKDAIAKASIYGRLWDSNSGTPWYNYISGGSWHQTWYDDDNSLGLKLDIVNSENIRGVGFWALGAEGNNASVWKVVRKKIVIGQQGNDTSIVIPTAISTVTSVEPTGTPKSPGFGLVVSLAALLTWFFMIRQRNK